METTCTDDGCTKRAYAQGLCRPAYNLAIEEGRIVRAVRHELSEIDLVKQTARCLVCGPTTLRVRRDRPPVCSVSDANSRRSSGHDEHVRHLRRFYGMGVEDFDALVLAQGGRCAICSDELVSPHVDHHHSSGKVRGLLCQHCNIGIGQFLEDPDRLMAAVVYLRE